VQMQLQVGEAMQTDIRQAGGRETSIVQQVVVCVWGVGGGGGGGRLEEGAYSRHMQQLQQEHSVYVY
jgi:hypothetical protein